MTILNFGIHGYTEAKNLSVRSFLPCLSCVCFCVSYGMLQSIYQATAVKGKRTNAVETLNNVII